MIAYSIPNILHDDPNFACTKLVSESAAQTVQVLLVDGMLISCLDAVSGFNMSSQKVFLFLKDQRPGKPPVGYARSTCLH